jgi:hypothetical protein
MQDEAPGKGFILRVLMRNPKDLAAGTIAAVAVAAIVGNAMFMQAGRHPAPMFSTAFPPAPASPPGVAPVNGASGALLPRARPADAELHSDAKAADIAVPAARGVQPAVLPQSPSVPRPPAPVPHADPVGDLIASTRRIGTVQRVLTEFGYGQLKPTGVAGTETRAAVEKFERDRKLPVTGQITDRLVRELAVATGRQID